MGLAAARGGDLVVGSVTTPSQSPFSGALEDDLAVTVRMNGSPAAVVGSGGLYELSQASGGASPSPEGSTARIIAGSSTVRINGRPAARLGDPVVTFDSLDAPTGTGTVATGPSTVFIG